MGNPWRQMRVAALALVMAIACSAVAEARRVALVIGNGAYEHARPLRNPANDARDFAAALKRLGFEVQSTFDANGAALAEALSRFVTTAQGAEVALMFYAGHGLQFGGRNYLVPVDGQLASEFSLRREAMPVDDILSSMQSAAKVSLVFLDACRNNPLVERLQRSLASSRNGQIGRGLARMDVRSSNALIVFATAPGEVAEDGQGRNSPFVTALLRHIETPGTDIEVILKDVTSDVRKATRNRQKPERLSRLEQRLVLKPQVASAAPRVVPPPVLETTAPRRSLEREASFAWGVTSDSCDREAIELFRKRYGQTYFGDLAAKRLRDIAGGFACRAPAAPIETVVVPAPAPVAASPPAAQASPSPTPTNRTIADPTFARELQTELKRVGCYGEDVDGRWGGNSAKALQAYARIAKRSSKVIGETFLGDLRKRRGRVCPLVCGSDEVVAGDRCVARPKEKPKTDANIEKNPQSPARQAAACVKKSDVYTDTCSERRAGCTRHGGGVRHCNAALRECIKTGRWIYRRDDGTCFDWGTVRKE